MPARLEQLDLGRLGSEKNKTKGTKLVGGFNPSEKYESIGMIIPNLWKNMET